MSMTVNPSRELTIARRQQGRRSAWHRPLQYSLSWHTLEHLEYESGEFCTFERAVARGDTRLDMTGVHERAVLIQRARRAEARRPHARIGRAIDDALVHGRRSLTSLLSRLST